MVGEYIPKVRNVHTFIKLYLVSKPFACLNQLCIFLRFTIISPIECFGLADSRPGDRMVGEYIPKVVNVHTFIKLYFVLKSFACLNQLCKFSRFTIISPIERFWAR